MGKILSNYPPKKPLTEKDKRARKADLLINKATKFIWWYSMKTTIMKTLIGIYIRLIYAIRALKQIRRPHLGDIVYYQGIKYSLIQGVNSPYWDLFDMKARIRINSIHESKFQLQPLYCRFFFSFRFTYRFYMSYWYGIDVHNRGRFIFDGKLWRISK